MKSGVQTEKSSPRMKFLDIGEGGCYGEGCEQCKTEESQTYTSEAN